MMVDLREVGGGRRGRDPGGGRGSEGGGGDVIQM